jgi:hypothetical protein
MATTEVYFEIEFPDELETIFEKFETFDQRGRSGGR